MTSMSGFAKYQARHCKITMLLSLRTNENLSLGLNCVFFIKTYSAGATEMLMSGVF